MFRFVPLVMMASVALADVQLRNNGAQIASAGEVDLEVQLIPLLRKELRTDQIDVKRATITLHRDHDGKLNVAARPKGNGALPALAAAKLAVSDATVDYSDEQSGKEFQAAGQIFRPQQIEAFRVLLVNPAFGIVVVLLAEESLEDQGKRRAFQRGKVPGVR